MKVLLAICVVPIVCCGCRVIPSDHFGIQWGGPLRDRDGYSLLHTTRTYHGLKQGSDFCVEWPNPRRPWIIGMKGSEYAYYIASDWAYNARIDFWRQGHDVAASVLSEEALVQGAAEAVEGIFTRSERNMQTNTTFFAAVTRLERSRLVVDGKRYEKLSIQAQERKSKRRTLVEVYARPYAYEPRSDGIVRFYVVEVTFLLNEARSEEFKREAREHLQMILRSLEFPPTKEMSVL